MPPSGRKRVLQIAEQLLVRAEAVVRFILPLKLADRAEEAWESKNEYDAPEEDLRVQ